MGKVGCKLLIGALLLLLVLSSFSCSVQQVPKGEKPPMPVLNTIVVIGFRPALAPSRAPGLVRSPISGAIFLAEPVSDEVANWLSEAFFEMLSKIDGRNWVSPREAAAAFSQLASSNATWTDKEIYVKIGKVLSADGVVGGHVYRWQEREGTAYAASRPASVAFDVYLMSAGDGVILWKARFDKTQASLSENVFDFNTFFKAKGRWMTAAELAEIGLTEFVEAFPKPETGKK
jgi:hypothetical protein